MSGSVGAITFYMMGGKVYAKQKNLSRKTPTRTANQMTQRMRWANMVNLWRRLGDTLMTFFEGKSSRIYTHFISANSRSHAVYLTKEMQQHKVCVVAPYQVSEGSLPAIDTVDSHGTTRTDIALGGLVIDDQTTVSQFSLAVVSHNKGYTEGDVISHLLIRQENDPTYGPDVSVALKKVRICASDTSLLWQHTGATGFSTVDGYLGAAEPIVGGQAWVLQRSERRRLKVSPQRLVVNNPLYDQLSSEEALREASDSYGGVNKGNDIGYVPNSVAYHEPQHAAADRRLADSPMASLSAVEESTPAPLADDAGTATTTLHAMAIAPVATTVDNALSECDDTPSRVASTPTEVADSDSPIEATLSANAPMPLTTTPEPQPPIVRATCATQSKENEPLADNGLERGSGSGQRLAGVGVSNADQQAGTLLQGAAIEVDGTKLCDHPPHQGARGNHASTGGEGGDNLADTLGGG